MPSREIRDMTALDERFVASCTHVGETEEWDRAAERRLAWLHRMYEQGLRVKVALLDGQPVGFLYLLPIEVSSWGPAGRDLAVIQCLCVKNEAQGHGLGRSLLAAAEVEARDQGAKGLVVTAYYHDFWFMPATFFENCGYQIAWREGEHALLWKVFDPAAEPPRPLQRRYTCSPVSGKVVVDLFWSSSCLTTETEAQRVREVAAEFSEAVVLHEYCTDDPIVRDHYGLMRGIFINGSEIGWGYEAPREGIRSAIRNALGDTA